MPRFFWTRVAQQTSNGVVCRNHKILRRGALYLFFGKEENILSLWRFCVVFSHYRNTVWHHRITASISYSSACGYMDIYQREMCQHFRLSSIFSLFASLRNKKVLHVFVPEESSLKRKWWRGIYLRMKKKTHLDGQETSCIRSKYQQRPYYVYI